MKLQVRECCLEKLAAVFPAIDEIVICSVGTREVMQLYFLVNRWRGKMVPDGSTSPRPPTMAHEQELKK